MTSFRLIITAIILMLAAQTSYGEMFVDRSIVTFSKEGSPREDVKVSNSGDENIYVQVEVFAVNDPGGPDEERVKLSNPQELGLIATPNKLVIPPNGQKLVRLVNLQTKNNKERVYRINVTPILPPLAEETSQLRIVVAYQILTIVNPSTPKTELSFNRIGKTVSFSNAGNSNLLLNEGTQCNPKDPKQCNDLPSHRLYAGNNWEIKVPFEGPLNYAVRSFDGIKKQLIP